VVCCGVLQCVAVCCRVLQCCTVCCSVLCSVLQCVAVCCNMYGVPTQVSPDVQHVTHRHQRGGHDCPVVSLFRIQTSRLQTPSPTPHCTTLQHTTQHCNTLQHTKPRDTTERRFARHLKQTLQREIRTLNRDYRHQAHRLSHPIINDTRPHAHRHQAHRLHRHQAHRLYTTRPQAHRRQAHRLGLYRLRVYRFSS